MTHHALSRLAQRLHARTVGISTPYVVGFARCCRAFGVDGATGIRFKTLGRDHLLPAVNKGAFVVVVALARRVRPSSVRSVSVGAIRMREGSTHICLLSHVRETVAQFTAFFWRGSIMA